jgi:hypothetical protein
MATPSRVARIWLTANAAGLPAAFLGAAVEVVFVTSGHTVWTSQRWLGSVTVRSSPVAQSLQQQHWQQQQHQQRGSCKTATLLPIQSGWGQSRCAARQWHSPCSRSSSSVGRRNLVGQVPCSQEWPKKHCLEKQTAVGSSSCNQSRSSVPSTPSLTTTRTSCGTLVSRAHFQDTQSAQARTQLIPASTIRTRLHQLPASCQACNVQM